MSSKILIYIIRAKKPTNQIDYTRHANDCAMAGYTKYLPNIFVYHNACPKNRLAWNPLRFHKPMCWNHPSPLGSGVELAIVAAAVLIFRNPFVTCFIESCVRDSLYSSMGNTLCSHEFAYPEQFNIERTYSVIADNILQSFFRALEQVRFI